MPETKFDDHRYAEHIGLARPYGMSQVNVVQVWIHLAIKKYVMDIFLFKHFFLRM